MFIAKRAPAAAPVWSRCRFFYKPEWLQPLFAARHGDGLRRHQSLSREIIGYDPKTDKFPSHVYSNMSPQALPYEWDIQGDDLTITVNYGSISSAYHGKIAPDGNSFSGGWRPNPGADENINPHTTTLQRA